MVFAKEVNGEGGVKKICINRVTVLLCAMCLIWSLGGTSISPAESTNQSGPRSATELASIMNIQIPGWQRVQNPVVTPVLKEGETEALIITVRFHSELKTLTVTLINPVQYSVARIISKVPKENAQNIRIKGFDAIKVSPPFSPYNDYENSLTINVADRYAVIITGREVIDFETLLNVANLINLKKLATIS